MPPKAKITREMIVDAAFEIVRSAGLEGLNARTIAEKLGCSTQPVLWHFARVSDIKHAAYEKAEEFHNDYVMSVKGSDPMKEIGLSYIRFAAEEPHLFRFLFQTNTFAGTDLKELMNDDGLYPILRVLAEKTGATPEQTKRIFKTLFLYVHGYAAMLANNAMRYDEEEVSGDLASVLIGAVYAAKKGADDEKTV